MTTRKRNNKVGCVGVGQCIEHCTGSIVHVEEKGVRATFHNRKKEVVRKIQYDGCYAKRRDIKQADYIIGLPGVVDVILELKGSDTNLAGERGAAKQLEYTLHEWRQDDARSPRVAALIIYGSIQAQKKRTGRVPRATAVISGLQAEFLKVHRILLLIHENGERRFNFNDFLKKNDVR